MLIYDYFVTPYVIQFGIVYFLLSHLNELTFDALFNYRDSLVDYFCQVTPTWTSASGMERFLLPTTALWLPLIGEVVLPTFFCWVMSSSIPIFYLFPFLARRLLDHLAQTIHQLYATDVRISMSGPLAMNLLSWRSLPRNPRRTRPQGKIYPYHYGIYVRIQYRIRRRKRTANVPADVANQCDNEDTPDPDPNVRQQESANTPEVKEPDPPPRDYAREFDEMTAKSNWNIPNLMNDVEQLHFETFYGLTKTAAWNLLEGLCCPAQLFRYEKGLMSTDSLMPTGEKKRLEQVFIAATSLLNEMNLPRKPSGIQSGAYLTENFRSWEVPIVIDTGASFSLTPFVEDFVDVLEDPDISEMHGLSDSVQVKGVGWIEWSVRDPFGQIAIIRTRAYYVPQASIRLLSPQVYFGLHEGGHGWFDHRELKLTTPTGTALHFPYQAGNSLPMAFLDNDVALAGINGHLGLTLQSDATKDKIRGILHDNNHNLSRPQKELSLWHGRLGHCGIPWVQTLMRPEKHDVGSESHPAIIPTKHQATCRVDAPKCPGCLLAKQHRLNPKSQTTSNKPEREMALRRDVTEVGAEIHTDQYVSKTPGRLPHTFGKEPPTERYHGGTIFVDAKSAYVHLVNQVSLRIGETLVGKRTFEMFARQHGIKLKHFHADNHPFNAKEFRLDLEDKDQTISYSGAGAHFQNGVAERTNQTITNWARAMMMHQLLHWPEAFDPALWPFAMEHATHIWNNLPRQGSRFSPLEIFTSTKSPNHDVVQRLRVWGCPAYVLDPTLQDGKKLPKWNKRSRVGVYLGCSAEHHSTVGRILNRKTGHISPQYHVIYDETFSTVAADVTDTAFDAELWENLLTHDPVDNHLAPEDRADPEVTRVAKDLYDSFVNDVTDDSPVPEGEVTDVSDSDSNSDSDSESAPPNDGTSEPDIPYTTRYGRKIHKPQYAATLMVPGKYRSVIQPSDRYQKHVRECYLAGGNPNSRIRARKLQSEDIQKLDWNPASILTSSSSDTRRILSHLLHGQDEGEAWHPMALKAKGQDPDLNPTWEQAMNGPLADGYMEAARKEYQTLVDMNVWEEVDREGWMNVLPSTWAFRKKLNPSGLVKKLKARFCARGDRQLHGTDYFDTFAPVVSWTTVRLLLILSLQLELASKQIDYTAAFVHADIDLPPGYELMTEEEKARQGVFVEMPRGFSKPGKVLKLKKSLYGLKQAPRNFFLHLKDKLERVGFEQATEIDPCLFISEHVICLVYVDDTLLFARDMKHIDDILEKLVNEQKMALEVEDDVAGFLGVHIDRNAATGEITLTQTGLIERILEALGVQHLPAVATPAEQVLGRDEEGDPPNCTFNYASVIGMLWYVYGHSRPDLGFAVSQAARHAFAPKRSHELALIRIGQYLKGTADKGLILKPIDFTQFHMDVYVDSDFMGLYGKEKRSNPENVKSRAGHVILLNGCPIVWSSKLMQSIALSTMMAEYYALSSAMREVLPLRDLCRTVGSGFGINDDCLTSFHATVWEDNAGALALAQLDPGQHTARSKFYDVKVHWFRSKLGDDIKVEKVDTKEQLADMFTKPLPRETFEYLRRKLLGW